MSESNPEESTVTVDLSKLVSGEVHHEAYMEHVAGRGDLPVKAKYVKNPTNYRPILWALHGKPEKRVEAVKTDTDQAADSTNPMLAKSTVESGNPMLAKSTVESGNPMLAKSTVESGNPMLAKSTVESGNPMLAKSTVESGNPMLAGTKRTHCDTTPATDAPAEEPSTKKPMTRRDERRGQNKDRTSNVSFVNVIAERQLCHGLAGTNSCHFGDKCKHPHDVKAAIEIFNTLPIHKPVHIEADDSEKVLAEYMSGEITSDMLLHTYANVGQEHGIQVVPKLYPGDDVTVLTTNAQILGEGCPYRSERYCPFGINCRMEKHFDNDGHNISNDGQIVDDTIVGETKFAESIVGLNDTPSAFKSQLKKLKKQKDAYPLSNFFLKNYKKESQFESAAVATTEYDASWDDLTSQLAEMRTNIGLAERPAVNGEFLKGKLILAPLTTVGNLPFRRLCTHLGADVTVSEMAVARSLLDGNQGEHALLKRHPEEKCFGVQLAGGYPDEMIKVAEMLETGHDGIPFSFDFVDINMGCPLEPLHKRFGGGSILMTRRAPQEVMIRGMSQVLSRPLTVKFRNDHFQKNGKEAHKLVPRFERWGASALIHHGRSAKARYTGHADWDYIHEVMKHTTIPIIGNGDVFSPFDVHVNKSKAVVEDYHGGMMIGRGALIKPWIFEEIKSNKIWDISSSQRLDYLRRFCSYGLDHWGSDSKGVETTRRFILEAQSFLHRYTPVGLLERQPAHIQGRPPPIQGRNELETLMASPSVTDWMAIAEMLLGKASDGFDFVPKHKSSSYAAEANN